MSKLENRKQDLYEVVPSRTGLLRKAMLVAILVTLALQGCAMKDVSPKDLEVRKVIRFVCDWGTWEISRDEMQEFHENLPAEVGNLRYQPVSEGGTLYHVYDGTSPGNMKVRSLYRILCDMGHWRISRDEVWEFHENLPAEVGTLRYQPDREGEAWRYEHDRGML